MGITLSPNFDYFNQADPPNIFLCNPNKQKLYSIGRIIYDTQLILRFNALSDFNFVIPQTVEKGNSNVTIPAYSFINAKRLIYIDNIGNNTGGYFVIVKTTEDNDGSTPIMKVECQSLDVELSYKKVTGLAGTYKFSGTLPTPPPGAPTQTLMDYIISLMPNWSLGNVDTEISAKYRTFDVSDETVYAFLLNEVEKAYECVFSFDIVNRIINVSTIANATILTDIFLSYDNVIKNSQLSEISDEIVTGLHVYGGNSLDIRSVNPLGTNVLYNFSYYKNKNWMSDELIAAITAWETKLAIYLGNNGQGQYWTLITNIMNANITLSDYKTQLDVLNNDMAALEVVKKAKIEQGLSLTQVNLDIAAKQTQIDTMNANIKAQQAIIDGLLVNVKAINTDLSFTNTANFTPATFLELQSYIIENTYQNDNIITTDKMTPADVQKTKIDLYNQAINVLNRVSVPRYEFSATAVNFINLFDFYYFSSKLQLGSIITLDTGQLPIQTVLLELELSYDNPENFKITFSNRLRKDNAQFQYSDLMGQVVKTGSSVSFNSPSWANWSDNYKDDVTSFITSALDTSKNTLINSSNQEITISAAGLRGRRYTNGTYGANEVWLTSNILAFTDNAWNTSKLALGSITVNGQTKFGLVGDVIVGKILAGNQLTIANDKNNFLLDQNGATLTNAKFSLNNPATQWNITLDPTIGIKMSKGTTTAFLASISDGSLTMIGNLDSGSNYIHTDGYAKIGALTITPTTATFDGTIQATKLSGTIDWSQITNVPLPVDRVATGYPAGSVGAGTMSGVNLNGAKGAIKVVGATTLDIESQGNMMIHSTGGYIGINSETNAGVVLGTSSYIGDGTTSNNLIATHGWVQNQGYLTNNTGYNQYTIYEREGNYTLYFNNGLFTGSARTGNSPGISVTINPFTTNSGNWRFNYGILISTNY